MTTDTPAPRFTHQDMLAWANNSKLTPTVDGMLRQGADAVRAADAGKALRNALWDSSSIKAIYSVGFKDVEAYDAALKET